MFGSDETFHLAIPVSNKDHIRGPENAPVTLVEYGDFQCDNCGEAYPIVKELQRRMGSRLRLVFRNFPLVEIHRYAEGAAEASEAAAAQGQFWKMHDIMFENQEALGLEDLRDYATRIGLDVERFMRELTGRMYRERVQQEEASGDKSGVDGTPTFFINGIMHQDSYDVETLLEACEHAAQQHKGETRAASTRPRGTAKKTLHPRRSGR